MQHLHLRFKTLAHRPDLDGVRGYWAVAIVLHHLAFIPQGAPVGVDVFFVMSGFLITHILMNDFSSTGRISLAAFYARRARRLLPTAAVVIVVTVAASFFVWFRPRALSTLLDGVASASFTQNWHLIGAKTDYLTTEREISPLQHFWSLAVEEQFYAFLPVLMIACIATTRRLDRRQRIGVIAAAMVTVTAASMMYCAWLTDTALQMAYFDAFGRAWEFGIGSIFALASPAVSRIGAPLRNVVATIGLASMVLATLFTDAHAAFPWPRAVVAVVGVALVATFGTGSERGPLAFLRWPPAVWLGRRSYSLYLWHFPIAILLPDIVGRPWWWIPVALAVTFAVALVSFRFVEEPARRSAWLRRFERTPPASTTSRWRSAEVAIPALVITIIVSASWLQTRTPRMLGNPTVLAEQFRLTEDATSTAPELSEDELRSLVRAAARSDRWPADVRPQLDDVFTTLLAPAMNLRSGCYHLTTLQAPGLESCTLGDPGAPKHAIIIGDSTAASWTPALTGALARSEWEVRAMTFSNCPPMTVRASQTSSSAMAERCAVSRAAMIEAAVDMRPDLVVVADGLLAFAAIDDDPDRDAVREWSDGTFETLRRLQPSGARLVVLNQPPPGPSLESCPIRTAGPSRCVATIDDDFDGKRDAESRGVARVRALGADAVFVDVEGWFCFERVCPPFIGPHLVRADRSHLTAHMGQALAGVLRRSLGVTP